MGHAAHTTRFGSALIAWTILVSIAGPCSAQQINAFTSNAELVWTNANPTMFYNIEWASGLSSNATWQPHFLSLTDIQSTNSEIRTPVPRFYRVQASTDRITQAISDASPEIAAGYYREGLLSEVDSDLVASNIRTGTTIFGVEGQFTGDSPGYETTNLVTITGEQLITGAKRFSSDLSIDGGAIGGRDVVKLYTTGSDGASMAIGNNGDPKGNNPGVTLMRQIRSGGNAHGYEDWSKLYMQPGKAYAAYDARNFFYNTNSLDHYVAFQAAPNYSGTGGIRDFQNFVSAPTVSRGTITNLYHFEANEFHGTGYVQKQVAYCVPETFDNAVTNWAFLSAGTTPSWFGGNVTVGGLGKSSELRLGSNTVIALPDNYGYTNMIRSRADDNRVIEIVGDLVIDKADLSPGSRPLYFNSGGNPEMGWGAYRETGGNWLHDENGPVWLLDARDHTSNPTSNVLRLSISSSNTAGSVAGWQTSTDWFTEGNLAGKMAVYRGILTTNITPHGAHTRVVVDAPTTAMTGNTTIASNLFVSGDTFLPDGGSIYFGTNRLYESSSDIYWNGTKLN